MSSAPPLLREQADRARDVGDWRLAAALYEVHLGSHPAAGDAALWVQLGNCRKEAGDRDGALDAYRRGLDLAPERADTHLQAAHLHKLCGRRDLAAASYATALRLDPACADAGIELAALEAEPDTPSCDPASLGGRRPRPRRRCPRRGTMVDRRRALRGLSRGRLPGRRRPGRLGAARPCAQGGRRPRRRRPGL